MGVGVYPVLNGDKIEYSTDGKMLAKILDDTAKFRADELGFEPLMNFFGFDPEIVADEIDFQFDEEIVENWFSAEDGLASVNSLFKDLSENPFVYSIDSKTTESALDDLKELKKVLEQAKAKQLTWYLAIDI